MQTDADLYLICVTGGQAALSGKTLQKKGYKNVKNIGGFQGWKDADWPVEE